MIANAKNPRWAGADHKQIILDVQLIGEQECCTFVAAPYDCTTHGPMLFNFALQGLFGEVADSDEERILRGEIEPPEGLAVIDGQIINIAQAEAEVQTELNRRLAVLNCEEAKAQAEIDEEFAIERKEKVTILLAVKSQPGWPLEVDWPV